MSEEEIETTTYMDSDALLVGQYVTHISVDELRRYVALDAIIALNPWTDKTIAQAKQVEAFLLGKGPKAVE